jgi:DNA-directed RNA polymerase specialized sigma24 family protein
MSHDDDITFFLPQVREGEDEAIEVVWRNYFDRLVCFARRKLEGVRRREADEEDVALSAMNSFWNGMQKGKFEQIEDREDLWKLLVVITARKASAVRRRNFAAKRGGGQLWGESIFLRAGQGGEQSSQAGIEQVAEPSPEFADDLVSNCHSLLDVLNDPTLRQIATWTLEGYRTTEIAERLDCARRTVERKLERIRRIWSEVGWAPPRPEKDRSQES